METLACSVNECSMEKPGMGSLGVPQFAHTDLKQGLLDEKLALFPVLQRTGFMWSEYGVLSSLLYLLNYHPKQS